MTEKLRNPHPKAESDLIRVPSNEGGVITWETEDKVVLLEKYYENLNLIWKRILPDSVFGKRIIVVRLKYLQDENYYIQKVNNILEQLNW